MPRRLWGALWDARGERVKRQQQQAERVRRTGCRAGAAPAAVLAAMHALLSWSTLECCGGVSAGWLAGFVRLPLGLCLQLLPEQT